MKSTILGAVALVAAAGTASASLVIESWNESNPGALEAGTLSSSSRNDALSVLGASSLDGYFGSQIRLTKDAKVTYTFLGYEASYTNGFVAGTDSFGTGAFAGNKLFAAGGLMSFTQDASAGLLDFSFLTRNGKKGITNGDENIDNVGLNGIRNPDFFASIVGAPTALMGDSLYLFLDDTGAGPDNDHDDMVVRIDISKIAAVPLPAAAGLTGTALAALVLVGRRRRR